MKTLVLNKTYEPLFITTPKRAFLLVYLDKAQVLEYYEEGFRTKTEVYGKPAVIRITSRRISYSPKRARCTRKAVFVRDSYQCGYCGDLLKGKGLTWDHVMPKSRGGKKVWNNMITACKPCNTLKADRTPEEASMPLLWKPQRPLMFSEDINRLWSRWIFT